MPLVQTFCWNIFTNDWKFTKFKTCENLVLHVYGSLLDVDMPADTLWWCLFTLFIICGEYRTRYHSVPVPGWAPLPKAEPKDGSDIDDPLLVSCIATITSSSVPGFSYLPCIVSTHYITTVKVLLHNAVVSCLVCRCASMDDSLMVELCC